MTVTTVPKCKINGFTLAVTVVFFSQKKGLGTILSDLYVKSLMAALWNSEISPFYAPVGLSESAAPNGKVQSFFDATI